MEQFFILFFKYVSNIIFLLGSIFLLKIALIFKKSKDELAVRLKWFFYCFAYSCFLWALIYGEPNKHSELKGIFLLTPVLASVWFLYVYIDKEYKK